jgi:tetratricopeptide (TPR) repeat protein
LAVELGQQALQQEPDRVEILSHLARCHLMCGQPEIARQLATRALAMPRDNALVLDSLGVVMTRLDEQALAMELFDQAIALEAGQASMYFNRAVAQKQFGLIDGAERDLETCLALNPGHSKAHWLLANLRTQDLASNHLRRLRQRLALSSTGSVDEERLALALFKELDDLSDAVNAWPALERGIASRRDRQTASAPDAADITSTLISLCDERFCRQRETGAGNAGPIFILGMPRAGVALLGSLLSRHSKIHHLGVQAPFSRLLSASLGRDSVQPFDAADLERCRSLDFEQLGRRYLAELSSVGGKQLFICESQPMNFQLAGFIANALPGARILHVARDPLDTCVSILGHASGDSGLPNHDPGALAASYLDHHRLMQHWHQVLAGRIIDVNYESLVEKPEMILRVVCSFLGIRYASSLRMGLQLHRRSVGRGHRYAAQLPQLEMGLAPLERKSRSA